MPSPRRRSLLPFISLFLLLSSVTFWDRQIGQLLLPLYTLVIHLLLPESCQITSLQLIQQSHALCFTVTVETLAPTLMAGQSIPAGIILNGSTLLSHALLPPVIMLSSLFVWLCLIDSKPVTGPFIVLLLFLLIIVGLDVPLVLVGSLCDILHAHLAAHAPTPWQVRAMHLLNGGGRQTLALAAVFAAISLARQLQWLLGDHSWLCRSPCTHRHLNVINL